jgi:hypothetical protein
MSTPDEKYFNPAVHTGILVIVKYPFLLRERIKRERDIGLYYDGADTIIYYV